MGPPEGCNISEYISGCPKPDGKLVKWETMSNTNGDQWDTHARRLVHRPHRKIRAVVHTEGKCIIKSITAI